MILEYFLLIIISGFVYISLFWIYRILIVFSWIKRNKNKSPDNNEVINLTILIPVLEEADILEETVEYFMHVFHHIKNLHLVIVTTEKECLFSRKKTGKLTASTILIAKRLSEKHSSVSCIHYPYTNGKMAHQLNYAIKQLLEDESSDSERCLFGVYNADSRPQQETLDWIMSKKNEKVCLVFQQYGNYLKNIENLQKQPMSDILISAAIWQTRWSIGFEIFNALRQYRFPVRGKSYDYPLNYCIGHGLFFTRDIYKKLGGFSEEMHNEDAIFGLQLSYYQEPINPVPFFDDSDTPDSVGSLYSQKTNWYFGPMQAFLYYKKMINEKEFTDKKRLFILSAKLFSHAVFWVLGPTFLLLTMIIFFVSGNFYYMVAAFGVYLAFLVAPGMLTWLMMKSLKLTPKISSGKIMKSLILGSLPFYFLHGLSAYSAVVKYAYGKITKKTIAKEKTKMKRNC